MRELLWCFRQGPHAEMQKEPEVGHVEDSQHAGHDERWMHPSFLALLHRDHLSPIPESPQRLGQALASDICQDEKCPCMGSTIPASLPRPFEAEAGIPFSVLHLRSRSRSFDRPMREFIRSCGSDSAPSGGSLSPRAPANRVLSDRSNLPLLPHLVNDTPSPCHESPCDMLAGIQEDPERRVDESTGSPSKVVETFSWGPTSLVGARHDTLACRRFRDSCILRRISADSSASSSMRQVLVDPETINEDIEDYIIDILGCIVGLPIEFQSDYRTGMHLARTQLLKQFGAAQLSRSMGILHRIIEDAPEDANEASFLGVWARWKFPHAHRNARLPSL